MEDGIFVMYPFMMIDSFGLQSFTLPIKRKVVMAFLTDGGQEMNHGDNEPKINVSGTKYLFRQLKSLNYIFTKKI